jgi:hypothetical protein
MTIHEVIYSVLSNIDFPAVVLSMMLIGMAIAMVSAQKAADFDWGDAFRDDHGKISWLRAAVLVALAISSWSLIYGMMNGMRIGFNADDLVKILDALFWWYVAYMVVWAGTKTADKFLAIIQAHIESKK